MAEAGRAACDYMEWTTSRTPTLTLEEPKGIAMKKDAPIFEINCPNCGASLQLDFENLISFCPFCRKKLLIDPVAFKEILVEKEKTRRAGLRYEQKDKKRADAAARRAGKIKASAVLAIIGFTMMTVGWIAGDISGNPNSFWYTLALLGFDLLMAIPFIWLAELSKTN